MEVTRAELDVLQALRELEDRDDAADEQVRHLTQTLHIDESEAQEQVDGLVEQGYVRAPLNDSADTGPREAAVYRLTERGREALAAGPES